MSAALPPAAAKKFFEQKSMAWDDLTTPRELLEKLGSENGIEIAGLEQIPHDLWAAADLPPLELIERLTLIAGQYDLTFEVSADGNRITLVPVPEHVELVRTYPAGRQAQQTAKNLCIARAAGPSSNRRRQDRRCGHGRGSRTHILATSPGRAQHD